MKIERLCHPVEALRLRQISKKYARLAPGVVAELFHQVTADPDGLCEYEVPAGLKPRWADDGEFLRGLASEALLSGLGKATVAPLVRYDEAATLEVNAERALKSEPLEPELHLVFTRRA